MDLFKMKCFSITFAPNATAIIGASIPRVWSASAGRQRAYRPLHHSAPTASRERRAARADVEKAAFNLKQARWQLEQKNQAAPAAGFVFDTFYRKGEFVPAAYPIVSLLPPDHVKIRFFVPETVLAQLAVGKKVSVSLDGKEHAVQAEISYISPQAEYTPPVIYSREIRAKLVYMIEAVPDTAAAAELHPGQPVDVVLEPPNG